MARRTQFILLLVAFISLTIASLCISVAEGNALKHCIEGCVKAGQKRMACKQLCNSLHKFSDSDEAMLALNEFEQMADAESSAPIDDAEVWARYRSEIIRLLRRSASHTAGKEAFDGLQLVTAGIDLTAAEGDYQLQQMVQSPVDWSGTFSPQFAGRKFSDRYGDFLMSLETSSQYDGSNSGLSSQIDALEAEVDSVLMQLFAARGTCEATYIKYPESYRATMKFETFAQMYCPSYAKMDQQYKLVVGKAELLKRQAYGGLKNYSARKALGNFLKNQDRQFLSIGSVFNFANRCAAGERSKISLQVSSQTSEETTSFKQSSWGFNLFVISAQQQTVNQKLTTSKSEFIMEFSAQSWGAIRMVPDPKWFNGDVMRDYASGPFTGGRTPGNFFGQYGSVNLLPRTFYLVYKPKIVLKVNQVDAEQIQKASSMSIGISLFGLGFNFGKNSRLNVAKETDTLFKVEVESDSPIPQLFAVDNAILPN